MGKLELQSCLSRQSSSIYRPRRTPRAVLEPALEDSGERSAHVIGFHLIADLPVYGEFPAEVSEEVIVRLQKAGKEAAAGAKRAFDEHVQKQPVTHEWRCFTASYAAGDDLIAQHGRAADLIVCGKPSDEVPDAWSDFSETAIMRSGRPVLIVPGLKPQKTIGEHVIIAWNDTREAARAVFNSLDLIKAASTVRAVTFIEKENQRRSGGSARRGPDRQPRPARRRRLARRLLCGQRQRGRGYSFEAA